MIEIQRGEGWEKLLLNGERIAIDTPVMRDYMTRALTGFHGDVLVAGLGLGLALDVLADLPAVESVTVVERSPEVLGLFGLAASSARDAWTFEGAFDCAFLDIWPDYYEESKWLARRLEARGLARLQVSLPLTYEEIVN